MSEANKALIRRFLERCLNQGDIDAVGEFVSPEFVDHLFPDHRGIDGVKQGFRDFRTAFPDIHYAFDDIIAEGDRVVVRYTISGTHRGEFLGVPPSGRRVTWTGINIARINGGKFVERWGAFDTASVMRQLRGE